MISGRDALNYKHNIAFIADSMLGRLTKWLRLFGFDVIYFRDISDKSLIRKALKEKRTVLTRDTGMILRKEFSRGLLDYILIESDFLFNQLRQVLSYFSLDDINHSLPRCNICNCQLLKVEKKDVKKSVPPYVFKTQDRFSYCPKCQKYFWSGTHWKEIEKIKASFFKTEIDVQLGQGN